MISVTGHREHTEGWVMRKAIVRSDQERIMDAVRQYLPNNYAARWSHDKGNVAILIEGEDVAGWTLDGYVIPRLQSGLIWAELVPGSTEATPA